MIKRKIAEIGSILYRRLVFPFVRIGIEQRTKSVMKQGSYVNKGTVLKGKNYVGKGTVLSGVELGFGSYVSNYGDLSYTKIGRYTSIGPYVHTVLGKHPVKGYAALHPAFYSGAGQMGFTYIPEGRDTSEDWEYNRDKQTKENFLEEEYLDSSHKYRILIGNDVWIGQGVSILEGVRIGDGAVIGAGAVVTKDVAPYSICVGVPARKIRERFEKAKTEELLRLRWWEKDEDWIREHIEEFGDADRLLEVLKRER